MIITEKINKLINQDNYEILLVSEKAFAKNLASNLTYSSILKEMKIIFNRELIEKYKDKKYRFNAKKNLFEIEGILRINKDAVSMCEENKRNVPDGIAYSLVLRLRELCLIKCLFSEKPCYKKDFSKLINEKVYSAYLRIKRSEEGLNKLSANDLINVINLSEKWLKELKGQKKAVKA